MTYAQEVQHVELQGSFYTHEPSEKLCINNGT